MLASSSNSSNATFGVKYERSAVRSLFSSFRKPLKYFGWIPCIKPSICHTTQRRHIMCCNETFWFPVASRCHNLASPYVTKWRHAIGHCDDACHVTSRCPITSGCQVILWCHHTSSDQMWYPVTSQAQWRHTSWRHVAQELQVSRGASEIILPCDVKENQLIHK